MTAATAAITTMMTTIAAATYKVLLFDDVEVTEVVALDVGRVTVVEGTLVEVDVDGELVVADDELVVEILVVAGATASNERSQYSSPVIAWV